MNILKIVARIFLLILSGTLLSFAHYFQYDRLYRPMSWPNIIIATVGLLLLMAVSLKFRSKKGRFLAGFLGGIVFYGITIYWIALALHQYGNIHLSISVFACALLSSYCALYTGLWAMVSGADQIQFLSPMRRIFCWAALWAGLEAVRQTFLSGFIWGELGFGFAFSPMIARSASVWGVHGLTFIWILFAAALLQFDQFFSDRNTLRKLLTTFVLLIVVGIFGYLYPASLAVKQSVKIATVQANISQEVKWNPGQAGENLQQLVQMTQEASAKSPHLIIWPETSYPFLVTASQKQMPFSSTIPLIAGAVVRDGSVNRNSALLIENDQIVQRFEKVHLVPFGEYVPLARFIPFGKLVANAGDFVPGSKDQPVLQPNKSPLKIGALICYEDVFADISARHAKAGANLLVNITNDAWYGTTSAQTQHAAMAALQVFQTGLPMVRATNNGLTSFISLESRIDEKPFIKSVSVEEVNISSSPKKTFFVLTYPLMEWIWFIIFGIAFLWKEAYPHQSNQRRMRKKKIFFPD